MKTKKIVIKDELEKTISEIKSKQDQPGLDKELDELYQQANVYERIIEDYGEGAEITIRRLTFREQCKIYDRTANIKLRGNVTVGNPQIEAAMMDTVKYGLVSINGEEVNVEDLDSYLGEWLYEVIQDYSSVSTKKKRY